VTPITDLQVKEQDLVVATQGRSLWILDDLSLLHQLAEEAPDAEAALFEPGLTYRLSRARSGGDRQAQNPPNGAVIRYYLAEEPEDTISLEVRDGSGGLVRRFSSHPDDEDDPKLPKERGVNRFVWDLTHEPLDLPDGAMAYLGYTGGPTALPGEYEVGLSVGDWTGTQPLEVRGDPRMSHVTTADLRAQLETASRIRGRMEELYESLGTLRSVREQAKGVAKRAKDGGFGDELTRMADSITAALNPIEELLIQTKAESGQDPINFPPQLDNQFGYLYRHVAGAYGRPTAAEMERLRELEGTLAGLRGIFQAALDEKLPAFNQKVQELGVPPITLPRR
jgi:hypothetical protein